MKSNFADAGRGALNLIAVLAVVLGLQALIHKRVPDWFGLSLICICLVATYLAGVRWIERRRPAELLHHRAFPEFAAGLTLGLALFGGVMAALRIFGVYHPSGWGTAAPLAAGFLLAVPAGIFEEIVFRGFLFRLSAKLLGTWGALAVTSALFGAAHAFNPGATVGSSAAIALEAGVLLGAAYALTERLWLPIGLHVGWNFAEGSIFGMSVSGGAARRSLINGSLQGNNLLTGGAFGPEASIVAVVICLAAAVLLLRQTVHLDRVEPPPWVRVPTEQTSRS
jgi:CAAX protease family protein